MKTKRDIFLEDITNYAISTGRDIVKNNLFIPYRDNENRHEFESFLCNLLIGGFVGLGLSEISQNGSSVTYALYGGIGTSIGGAYSLITLVVNEGISPAIRSAVRNYINSLEERASHKNK